MSDLHHDSPAFLSIQDRIRAVVAVLLNPTSPTADSQLKQLQDAAHTLALQLYVLHASAEGDFDKEFATLLQLRLKGLVVASDTFFATHSEQLAALTARHAVPAIHQSRDFALAGGLMSYGGRANGCPPRTKKS